MVKDLRKIAMTGIPGYDPRKNASAYDFNLEVAQDYCDFFPCFLKHQKGDKAGNSFDLEPWEQAIIANLFGWQNKQTGLRRYKECLIFVPRKNGKTTLAAGITDLVHFKENEPGMEIYNAAASRDQARYCFELAKGMVNSDEYLTEHSDVYKNSIVRMNIGSVHKPLSADKKTNWTYSTYLAVFDELHSIDDPDFVDAIETSTGARKQSLIIHLTTSDWERISVCNEKYDYACKVRDGLNDPEFLPVIYEALTSDDWKKQATWKKANPSLGVTVSLRDFKKKCKKAQEIPRLENTFKRLHLNMKTEQENRWIAMEAWDACGTDLSPFIWRNTWLEKLKGKECIGGLDLGSISDLTALALLFSGEENTTIMPFFWLPDEGDWRKSGIKRMYATWIKQGFIKITPGNVADYEFIRKDINAIASDYGVKEIPVDRIFQGAHLCTLLQDDGMEVIAIPQTFMHMTAPSLEFESRIRDGKFRHGGNPVLRWMVSNVCAQTDATGKLLRPVKPKNARAQKIDGVVAIVMALGRIIVQPENPGSGYSDLAWGEHIEAHT